MNGPKRGGAFVGIAIAILMLVSTFTGYKFITAVSPEVDQKFNEVAMDKLGIDLRDKPAVNDDPTDEIVDPTTLEIPAVHKFNIKYIILGALVGLFLACGWIVFIAIISGRLLTNDDIESQYGLSQMGVWRVSAKPKGIFGWLDRLIIKLFDSKGSQFTPEESLEMIAAGIRISSTKNNWKNIYLTSTANDDLTQESLSNLAEKLKGKVGSVSFGKSVVYDPESLEKMSDSDAAVLVEKVDTSKMSEIRTEYSLCKKYEVPIIGYVTLK